MPIVRLQDTMTICEATKLYDMESWCTVGGWGSRPTCSGGEALSKVSEQNIYKSRFSLTTSESLSPWIGCCIRIDWLHAMQPGCTNSVYSNCAAKLDIRHRIKMESCKKSSNMCVGDKKIWQGSYFLQKETSRDCIKMLERVQYPLV